MSQNPRADNQQPEGPKSFSLISFNANHTPNNVSALLDTHQSHDIIFIQEPWYGTLRHIPSSTSPQGDPYHGTQTHPCWILLEPQDTQRARVVVYIHRQWKHAQPAILSGWD